MTLPTAFPEDRPPTDVEGWRWIVDPNRDCRIHPDGDRLTIEVPGTLHDLSAEAGDMSAPRVLREIEGDFIAQVKVGGKLTHWGDRTSQKFYAYHGGGLLLWQDERNYVRLERAALHREDGVVQYANFELRKDGERFGSPPVRLPDQDFYLRVERRGGRVCGAVSPDGGQWHYLNPLPVTFPGRIELGVAAINTSTDRLEVTFTEREVYKKEPEQGP